MPIEQQLRPIWKRWNGVIPIWEAEQAGVDRETLLTWAQNNPDTDIVTTEAIAWYPDYPETESINWEIIPHVFSLASAGPGAYLWGPSVLEFAELGTWGSGITFIATPREQPENTGIHWTVTDKKADSSILGFLSQNIRDAILSSMRFLDGDKYVEALEDANSRGIITDVERLRLEKAKYRQ
ncbi:hypothetical protein [Bifidobacterium callitrichidarum]|uniref:Uncharacterized protein n=1 Tax=Bifidobacterium callitrichidarum TaxID=2052941 RepID=A0A2U2N985_9BIFI|nr:hypothetical protein [Bifidobacterium callitrichidarum]PWG65658.1 hypothetical protein DF196_06920 [Bifidobacterium callitrichidarum]